MFPKKTKMAIQVQGLREICETVLKLVGKMIYQFNSIKRSSKNQSQDCKAVSVSAINQSDSEFKQYCQQIFDMDS